MVEVVDETDLTARGGSDRGTRSASYNPAVLLGLLVQGYAIGVFSSRTRERATYPIFSVFSTIYRNDYGKPLIYSRPPLESSM